MSNDNLVSTHRTVHTRIRWYKPSNDFISPLKRRKSELGPFPGWAGRSLGAFGATPFQSQSGSCECPGWAHFRSPQSGARPGKVSLDLTCCCPRLG